MDRFRSAEQTRKVYLEQHKKYTADKTLFQRFLNMVMDPNYFHLTKEDFKGKNILDAGCGNSAYFEIAMIKLGVGRITCLDLGKEWIPFLKNALHDFGISDKKIEYVSGSTADLPFEDNSFDIVFSNGVLMHLYDENEIKKAFSELSRVTRRGGYLYVVLGCPGGFIEEEFFPSIRRFYRKNKVFKTLIDNITPDIFVEMFESIVRGMKRHTGEKAKFDRKTIKRLFDIDFCTFLQNVTQVPNRHILWLDEKTAFKLFVENGFEKPVRCRRYVKRKNIRKYFAPLHYDSDNKFARLLYGPGNLEYIARKK
ncbi:class I SAM-dependent methyltransferase [Candidatus Parcubacteria bacterium]|nr:class I SAM-dependent methyltransferase [Candidatus Parcubacteria bacterium]